MITPEAIQSPLPPSWARMRRCPPGYAGDAYYYGNRYYCGGAYQTGRYYYGGRYYANRYYHGGHYYYGGNHRHYGVAGRPVYNGGYRRGHYRH